MSLQVFQPGDNSFGLLQTAWAQQLNPIIQNPVVQSSILKNIPLTTGTNVINHKLGRQMQGWMVCDMNAAVTVYRSQPFNNLTLTLTSSGDATVSLVVF